ncbi:MAG: di-heme oxidoredictase family protein [Rikenellaceae bacterium]
MKKFLNSTLYFAIIGSLVLSSCQSTNTNLPTPDSEDTEMPDWAYAGGELGTTFNHTSDCFEQPSPAVENYGFSKSFVLGEAFFEDPFVTTPDVPMTGLGPAYVRNSCMHCHPGYGHGKRIEGSFNVQDHGNGYLICLYTGGEENATYAMASLPGMPQTMTSAPFTAYPPIVNNQVEIIWHDYTDQYGNKYEDGTEYSLIYPEVVIPENAFNVIWQGSESYSGIEIAVEATIGIYGTGLLDAISNEDYYAEYEAQQARGYSQGKIGGQITENDGTTQYGRYTYGQTRGTLQNGAGSNAIWNITNVMRKDRQAYYVGTGWLEYLKETSEFKNADDDASNYEFIYMTFKMETYNNKINDDTVLENENFNSYMATATQGFKDYVATEGRTDESGNITRPAIALDQDSYVNFMVWHRGLAVPSVRDWDDEEVLRGRELFLSDDMGCTACHKPSWTTGSDPVNGDRNISADMMPRYPNQTIWPYTDLLKHDIGLYKPGMRKYCRTTPLWGRGLHVKANGSSDRLHDMRARNTEEAILWHQGEEAEYSRDAWRTLSKSDREAMIAFIDAI